MNLFTRFLVASIAVVCADNANAQQVFFNNAAGPPLASPNQTAAQKKAFERELAFLVGDMQRTCELSEAQVKKLQLASKGAVASAMEKFEKQQKQMRVRLRQAGVNLPPGADENAGNAEDADKEEEEVLEPPAFDPVNVLNLVANGVGGPAGRSGGVAKEVRWVKAVEKVVTKEQREQYAAAVKARAAFARKSAVAAFIAKVDLKLLLSPDQRTKLTALVDEEFGKEMAKRVGQNTGGMFFFGGQQGRATAPIAHEELKPLLSEAQFAEWKQTFEKELNQLKPQRGFGGGFGNVIIRGAAPAVQEIRIEAGGDGN